ncbi:lasso peptide biosynthesis B2 protein [Roseateles chitinivorans]|uniref:lasso peptide biosynthesis B2 protein n=1 Tax=Roseateles chitinivorans TaxID=2917965 RepID=UPI003D66C11B
MTDCQRVSPLQLAQHVRCCECEGSVVLLDLQRGRYWNLGQAGARALAGLVAGWPVPEWACSRGEYPLHGLAMGPDSGDAARLPVASRAVSPGTALADRLLSLGLLARSSSQVPPTHVRLEEPCESLDPDCVGRPLPLTARRIGNFLQSSALAAWRLRRSSLQTIAAHVAAKHDELSHGPVEIAARAERSERAARVAPVERLARLNAGCAIDGIASDADDVCRLTAPAVHESVRLAALAFERLRPLAFSARDRCLHDSLSLVFFLFAEGLSARWVIGVKTNPFGAHSWVQSGRTVLNDQHEFVRAFRPILVV